MSKTSFGPGDRFQHKWHPWFGITLDHLEDDGKWRVHSKTNGSFVIGEVDLRKYYEFVSTAKPDAVTACRCEYPCSCTQQAREREKDRRIAELERQLKARDDRERRLCSAIESERWYLRKANNEIERLRDVVRDLRQELEAEVAAQERPKKVDELARALEAANASARAAHRWGSEGWNLANRLTAAIEHHRDRPGVIVTGRDMTLYRALEEADDATVR